MQREKRDHVTCTLFFVQRKYILRGVVAFAKPGWKLVYYYFTVWSKSDENGESLLDKISKKLVESERFARGRTFHTSFLIVYSKSMKNTDTAKEKGYDTDKKFPALNLTLLWTFSVYPSHLHNKSRCIEMVQLFISTSNNLGRVQNMLVDSGYSSDSFAGVGKKILGAVFKLPVKSDLHSFKVKALDS